MLHPSKSTTLPHTMSHHQPSDLTSKKTTKNELSNSDLPVKRRAWGARRRAVRRAYVVVEQPWERSTGPKTPAGKAVSAANATKTGWFSAENREALKRLSAVLTAQAKFVRDLVAAHKAHLSCAIGRTE